MKFCPPLFVFLALFCFGAGTPALATNLVSLRNATEIKTHIISLSDVFDGVPEALDREIALAPEAGQSVTYDVRVLSRLAEQYRLAWQPSSLADRATLTRAAKFITLDTIQQAVKEQLAGQDIGDEDHYELVFDNRNLSLAVPYEKDDSFTLANFLYDPRNRRFQADLNAPHAVRGGHMPVSGRVIVKKQVPVLTKRLKAGTQISQHDLQWKMVQEDHLSGDILMDIDFIVGQEARQDLAESSFVRGRDVIPPRLVIRGSLVTLKTQTPLMTITTQGRALQDGARGEVVRIRNIQSNRIIEGTVESSGTVSVNALSGHKMAAIQEGIH